MNHSGARIRTLAMGVTMVAAVVLPSCNADKTPPKPSPLLVNETALPQVFQNSQGAELLLMRSGTFVMGADKTDTTRSQDRRRASTGVHFGPPHRVELSAFYIGKYEVTKAELREFATATGRLAEITDLDPKFVRAYPGSSWESPADSFPVLFVTWQVANDYCRWLSERDGLSYRLPTEAEWEYAARAGTATDHWWGNKFDEALADCGSGDGMQQPLDQPAAVPGTYPANPWGLYDVIGNAFEWTADWYDGDDAPYYAKSPLRNPTGPKTGKLKVMRGGFHRSGYTQCNSYYRFAQRPDLAISGFRIVCDLDEKLLAMFREQMIVREEPPEPGVSALVTGNYQSDWTVDLGGGITIPMIYCPPGSFTMGAPFEELGYRGGGKEAPVTPVEMVRGFYMSVFEITQEQWDAVMLSNPSIYKGPLLPVNNVSRGDGKYVGQDAAIFCWQLTCSREGTPALPEGAKYRLPWETEWEYACRAGTVGPYSFGDPSRIGEFAWIDVRGGPRPVGTLLPNPWGFHDMHGNIMEWTRNGPEYYRGKPWRFEGDWMPSVGRLGGLRGGAWNVAGHRARSAARFAVRSDGFDGSRYGPRKAYDFTGFRIVRTMGKDELPPPRFRADPPTGS